MKISIEKMANYEIEVDKYFSNDIFSFHLANSGLLENRLQLFKDKNSSKTTRAYLALEKERKTKDYVEIGDTDFLMGLNMKHVYSADKYYTNGQNVISILKDEKGFEIGIHKNIKLFANYYFDIPMLNQFSLRDFKLEKYKILEKAEAEIMKVLSKVETTRIPVESNTDLEFLEIRKVYPTTYYFSLGNQTTIRKTKYNGDWIDKVTRSVIDTYKPHQVTCCINCKYFRFSAMSHQSTAGFTGYCFLVREKLEEITIRESTTKIWNWCSGFEVK